MNLTMVIPSYWGRESVQVWKSGDTVYDHPTPLDQEGTLKRAIDSISILKNKNFSLVIIAAANAADIEKRIEDKVLEIIKSTNPGVRVILFTHSHLAKMHDIMQEAGMQQYNDLLQLRGYSNIRNLCLFIPHILGSDAALLIDDDEIFEDTDFISKVQEFIGKEISGSPVYAIAGYYVQANRHYKLEKKYQPWMEYWDKFINMNRGFSQIIATEPRIKETPFVFGGNMVIHRAMFQSIPFDPYVTRGEDIDYLMNARMFGFKFYLDNSLSIVHLPPPKPYPTWKVLREDIYRFIYEREKIRKQQPKAGMINVKAEDFDPYPGCFLKDDLENKIFHSSQILATEYLAQEDRKNAMEALNNITIAKTEAMPQHDPFQMLLTIKNRWQEMMTATANKNLSDALASALHTM